MYLMRYSIDIVWLDEKKHVVGVYCNARPNQRPIAFPCPAYYMIEMPAGFVKKFKICKGDKLEF